MEKNENFQHFMYNIYDKLWGDEIIWIFISTGQEMFSEKNWNLCHNFLISYPIFIIFEPICREIFTLSFEIIKLDFPFKLIICRMEKYIRN